MVPTNLPAIASEDPQAVTLTLLSAAPTGSPLAS